MQTASEDAKVERVLLISQFTDDHGRFSIADPELPDFIEAESVDVKRYGVLKRIKWSENVVVVR